jgi:hypothetical protein
MWRRQHWHTWILVALFCLGAWRYFAATDRHGRGGGGVTLDGFYYYVYLHSVWKDRDLDLHNDYDLLGYDVQYGETETGKKANPFGVGPAILWAPFLLLAHLLALVRQAFGEAGVSLDPMSDFHQNVTLFGTYLYGCAAILVCYQILRRLFDRQVALLSALGIGLGGPLVYYMLACPSYAHAQSAFVFSGFLWCWLRFRDGMSVRRWLALGGLAGLLVLVHPGNAPLCLVALGTAAKDLRHAVGRRDPREVALRLVGPVAALLAAVLAFSPQMLAWKTIYGHYLLTPQGPDFMRFGESMWHATLFSPRQGLLPHAPLFAVSLLGLGLLLRSPGTRTLAGASLAALALLALVNGAVYDWWGWGFGARRYTVALPLFAIGLGGFVDRARALLRRHEKRLPAVVVGGVVLLPLLFNLQLCREYSKGNLDPGDRSSTRHIYGAVATGFLRDLSASVGNPLSFPANWAYAFRWGVEADRYDRLHGAHLLDDNHVGANPHSPTLKEQLNLADGYAKDFLLSGWGEPGVHHGVRSLALRDLTGRLLVPLNVTKAVRLTLRGRPVVAGTVLRLRFNGQEIFRETLGPGWQTVNGLVPRRAIRRGGNELELIHEPPRDPVEIGPREIGTTGRAAPVDLAAVGAGQAQGDFADIWVDGRRATTNRRGLNVTAVDPVSGKVLYVRGFDLHQNRAQSMALRLFVQSLRPGTIVVVASRDEASRCFDPLAREALRSMGAVTDLEGKWRQAYAAIGLQGAAPGTALEDLGTGRRAQVCVGRVPPPWRQVAAYEHLTLEME